MTSKPGPGIKTWPIHLTTPHFHNSYDQLVAIENDKTSIAF